MMPNFSKFIFESNQNRASNIALVDGTCSLTYGQLETHVMRFAAHLQSLGLQPQSRIIFYLDDCVEWPVAFLAAILAGLNPVCINHNNTTTRLEYLIDLVDASAVILDTVPDSSALVHWIVKSDILTAESDLTVKVYDFHDDEPCHWLMTSGTTGHPKAIVHRHKNLSGYYESTKDVYGVTEHSKIFATAKLSFGYGLNMSMTTALPVGATSFLMSGVPSPTRITEAVNQHGITHFYTVPTIINSILKHTKDQPMPSLQQVFSAGETLQPVLSKEFHSAFGVQARNTIGMSEVNAMYCIQDIDNYEHGTVGVPMPGIECKLLNKSGAEVAPGEVGELYIKSPCQALMYWKDWKYTNHTFQGDWIRTGDQMRLTVQGNYLYVSRLDDLVKINGQFVSSIEIEQVLMEMPAVYDCAVVFVTTEQFPKIHAFVMQTQQHQVTKQQIQSHVAEKLPYFKVPHEIHYVDSIPKTLTNKTKRTEMRDQLLQLL